ncbi:MAG: protein-glutamate methylesterase/protein-glutamine glutaminase [Bacillota bacterium]
MSQSLRGQKSRVIRVLIADDSLFMRHTLRRALGGHTGIQVVGEARDGLEALEKNAELNPDVVVMDVEMPRMDGLEALAKIMSDRPVPVIMFSSLTQRGAQVTFEALSLGAVDFMAKPQSGVTFNDVVQELARKVTAAASAKLRVRRRQAGLRSKQVNRRRSPDLQSAPAGFREAKSMVVIGTSTGGPQALDDVIPGLPADLESCVVVCQHMPAGFTASLAKRLAAMSRLPVREASTGEAIPAGTVLVAPGGQHLRVLPRSRGQSARFETDDGPPVHGVKPAVDVTLFDAAAAFGDKLMVVIMTGMGFDGAKGARAAKSLGAKVIAQDENTSVVWGMPRACYELGICNEVLPLSKIAGEIAKFSRDVRERE